MWYYNEADAATIHSTLADKEIQLGRFIGMGFSGAETFSGKHNGVKSLLQKNSSYAIYAHFHCHLQLACVQAANHTKGIKHVYTMLIAFWIFSSTHRKKHAACY